MADEFAADVAVVVGIDAYDPAIGLLQTPVRDAEAVACLLESFGYGVILLRDGEASKPGLEALLEKELPLRVTEGSRLLFYFAGHGVAQDGDAIEGPRGYLVPHGATSAVESHLPMQEVHKALVALPCRHLLVVLDCCFSGSFHWEGRRPMYLPGELLYEERYRYWVLHSAHWALASAGHDQYSLDIPDRRRGQEGSHSPFAAAFLAGLAGEADRFPEGGDGIITLAELYAYVRERLAPHQSPVLGPLKGQTRGEFVFRNPRTPLALQSAEIAVELKPELNPYRGLKPYQVEHAELFFGRADATRLLREHVEAHPWSVVVGPSGSGKSSLVHAGLLPHLRRETDTLWVAPAPFRVAGDPFAALRGALSAVGGPSPANQDLKDPDQAKAWATSWTAAHSSAHLLLVVDQAEELVTRVPRSGAEEEPESFPEEAARFLTSLAALIRGGGGRVRAVVVVRSDYETDLDDGPWSSIWKEGRFIVPPFRREDLREIIEGPAASRALYFDDPGLVDRLVDEVWGMPGGLPLLSYALSQLFLAYVRKSRGDRLLTAGDLQAIGGEPGDPDEGAVAPGGIVRVLRKGADQAVAALPDDSHRETLWRLLLRMVNLVGTRTTRRQVPEDELVYPEAAENQRVKAVRDYFIDEARLLVSDQNDNRDLIEPAHDELLVAWPELVRRIDEARVHLPVHRRLTEAAMEWSVHPDHPHRGLDLRLLALVEGSLLPVKWLNRAESDYLAAARQERRRGVRQRWLAIAAILALSAGTAFFLYRSIQQNQRATLERSQSLAHSAEAANRLQDFAAGSILATESLRLAKTEAALNSFALSKNWSWPLVSLLRGHTGMLSNISYSPDGDWLVTSTYFGDNNVLRLWDAKSFKPGPILSHANRLYRAVFHPNSRRVAVTDYADRVWIWDFSQNEAHVACSLRHDDVLSSTFEAQGRFLVTYSSRSARVWDLTDCAAAKPYSKPSAEVENHGRIPFDRIPLAWTFLTSEENAIALWRVESRKPIMLQKLEHPGGVTEVDISTDGAMAMTSGATGIARVWDLSVPSAVLKQELRHDRTINSGKFSRDGRFAVTASADGTAKVWEDSGGTFKLKALLAHGAEVKSAYFDPAGRWIASWSYPRQDAGPGSRESDILWIWDLESGLRTAALLSDVIAVDFSPDGGKLAVAGSDNTARIWKVGPARTEIPLDGFVGAETNKTVLGLDNQKKLVLINRYKEQVRIWDLLEAKERFQALKLIDQTLPSLFLSRDGARVVASDGRKVAQWNTQTGAPISLPPNLVNPFSMAPFEGGSLIVAKSDWGPEREGDLQLWDPRSGEIKRLKSRLETIDQILASENGAYVALVGTEKQKERERRGRITELTELWSIGDGTLIGRFQENLRLEAVHPQGRSVVGLIGPDNRFTVLTVGENHPRIIVQDNWVTSARFSPDGSQLVTASRDGTAGVWDTQLWKTRGILSQGAWVSYATFDPRGELIATTSTDGSTRIWNASTFETLAILQHHRPQRMCFFSPDSLVLVSCSSDKATVWRWREEIVDPEEERLAVRFSAARQLKGLASEVESSLRLPGGLPEAGSRASVREVARKLLAKAPSRSTIWSAADAVLTDPDPALAWIDLYNSLADHPRSNGYRLLVLEELEGRRSLFAQTEILDLLLAATRAEGTVDPDGGEGTADRLRENIRQRAQLMLRRGNRHRVVAALATASSLRGASNKEGQSMTTQPLSR